jgi:hypothetical protein
MILEQILNMVSVEEAMQNCPWSTSDNAVRTSKKEIIGNRLIRNCHIIPAFYGERGTHVTDKEVQLKGTDFKTATHNIDAKVSIGDFRDDAMHFYECIPVELQQNGKQSFTDDKDTTDVLYVNVNLTTNEVHFLSVPYDIILKIVKLNMAPTVLDKVNPLYIYDKKTSGNGSGCFIKMPVSRLVDLPGVYYNKIPLVEENLK